MKRYFAFAGAIYYPSWGMNNFVGDFDAIAEATDAAMKQVLDEGECPLMWVQVWDSETRTVVFEESYT